MRSLRTKLHALTGLAAGLALSCMALSGCNSSGCTENRSAVPIADFYSSTTGEAIMLDSVQIHGVGSPGDSILLAAGKNTAQVYLPMRSQYTSTSWCLSYKWKYTDNPQLNDTVTFDYKSIPWFAGEECGAMYYYRIERVRHTMHLLDSIAVTDSLITNATLASLRFYFRTAENPEEQ